MDFFTWSGAFGNLSWYIEDASGVSYEDLRHYHQSLEMVANLPSKPIFVSISSLFMTTPLM